MSKKPKTKVKENKEVDHQASVIPIGDNTDALGTSPKERSLPANMFYQVKSRAATNKRGRPRIINSPDEIYQMLHEFLEIKKDCYIEKPDVIKSGDRAGEQIMIKYPDYPTEQEFAHFCGFANRNGFKEYKKRGTEFKSAIEYVEEVIYNIKMKGAAIGMYSPAIVARDLGLADKKEHSVKPIEPKNEDEIRAEIARLDAILKDGNGDGE